MMRRLIGFLLLFGLAVWLPLPVDQAYSQNKYSLGVLIQATRDQAILDAFALMPGTMAEGALDTIVQRKTRVFFKNLAEVGKAVKDYDAISWISPSGEWVIFINAKHKTAPAEALAAVIAHEAIHHDPLNSIQEEVVAWHQEARVWLKLRETNPYLATMPVGRFPLVDRLNQLATAYEKGTLAQMVRANHGYEGLPETSPGFSSQEVMLENPYSARKQVSHRHPVEPSRGEGHYPY